MDARPPVNPSPPPASSTARPSVSLTRPADPSPGAPLPSAGKPRSAASRASTSSTDIHALSRSRLPSIRFRLTIWTVVIALVIQLTLSLVVFLYQASALNTIFDDRLRESTEQLAAEIRDNDVRITPPDLVEYAAFQLAIAATEPRSLAIYDELGVVIAESKPIGVPADILPTLRPSATAEGVTLRRELPSSAAAGAATVPWRFIARRLIDDRGETWFVVVGTIDSTYHSMLSLIRRVLFLSLPVGVIGAGVAGWLIAGLALAPVRRLRAVADALDPESIERPVSVDVGAAELEDVQAVIEDVRERLRLAFGARDRFIANVSHELKTPIAIILTEAQTLDPAGLSREGRMFVRSVIEEMRRLSRTIESFLTLTKIKAGKSLMEHTRCDVTDFVMDAVLGCSRMARQQKVTINPVLADTDQPLFVLGDSELLRVLVDNLLRNAIRFSPEDSQVILNVSESGDDCIISVRDFGPGIPEGVIDSVFEPVAQAPADATRGRRVSLGLSIAQTVAQMHSGLITARNLPDTGCEFVARIPREPSRPSR